MTPDGRYLAFVGLILPDPRLPPLPRLHLYDFGEQRLYPLSLHGDPNQPLLGFSPSISDDGRWIAYEAGPVVVFDTVTQDWSIFPTGESPYVYDALPQLSADGTKVAYMAANDLDPSVTNEDLEPELFLLDITSGRYEQVTDQTHYPFAADPSMDGAGSTFLLTSAGFLNGTNLRPATVRLQRRRTGSNANPRLTAPAAVTIGEGFRSTITLRAADADGDPITFFAQSTDPLNVPLPLVRGIRLQDYGNGTASLSFEPRADEEGTYRFVIAAFDEAGGVSAQPLAVIIDDTLLAGDANCDGRLDAADRLAVVRAIFEPLNACGLADINGDGRIAAADVTAAGVASRSE